ncbi:MAG: ABC transporter permease [Maledivibacter sp.]|jgi:simple sugar transport system permease protein|nr:ABC transporter permease [Maledivibacter sp.]
MHSLFDIIFSVDFGYAVLRVTTPILFAALGAVVSDRAGIVNIGLEGTMLISALMGVIVSAYTQSAWIGLIGAVLMGVLVAGVLAYFTLHFKTHIILGGIAINLFADGGSIFILYLLTHDKGTSASLPSKILPSIDIPIIENIPIIGDIFSGHNVLTYFSIISVILIYFMFKRTPLGLRIKAVGENPNAADSVGISVNKTRTIALLLSGALCGLGGAYMSMGYVSWFSRNMTAGRGWIALAAEAMGRGTTIGTALTSLLFGMADALSNSLGSLNIPAEFVQIIPYVATVIGLVVYASKEARKKKKLEG